jgi:lipopolysaccharide/colanic/teichoic acid biosynthesis glycosyltransferase
MLPDVILPYKGALEIWYQQHRNFYTDFMILFLTAWYVFFSFEQTGI